VSVTASICVRVSVRVCGLKGKQLGQSTPNLVIQCMTVACHVLTEGQKVNSQGHAITKCVTRLGMHVGRTALVL